MKIVVDTSLLIDHLRSGKVSKPVFDKLEEEKVHFYIPTIVIYELFAGKSSKTPSVKKEIQDFLRGFKRVELSEKIATIAGELFRDSKTKIGISDYIIAASALEMDATVVTLNLKHFGQIPGLSLYPLER